MMHLSEQLELESDITEYINQYAWIMDIQATPIILFNESSAVLYANKALHNLLNKDEALPTLEQLNGLFRGVAQAVLSTISDKKAKVLNKALKGSSVDQLIPYKVNIRPIIQAGKCKGALVLVEADVKRLTNYFIEEKSILSEKISALNSKLKNTFSLVTALFDNSPVGMMILDKQKNIIQINNSGAAIIDIKASTAIGMSSNRFYTASCVSEHATDITIPEEVNAVSWTGEKKILMRCSVISEGEDEDIFSVETFVDITEIEQARIAAEESNKVKTEFLANMSHELRTPLHTIMGFSQCGADPDKQFDTEKASDFFNKIYHGGEILLALVDNLLDVAKLDAGKVVFDAIPIQFDVLVKEVVKEFEAVASARDIKINIRIENDIKSMNMDEMRIKQVVRNIISNAVKFSTDKNDINVVINQTDEMIELQVHDHGPGIPENELESVFDKFIQSSRTDSGAGGTGLGLSICREILNQHNGAIWAENSPQGGAIFIVNLYLN